MLTLARTSLAVLLLSALALEAQAQILVPGDFPDPASALAAAPDGAVVVVRGGTWGPLIVQRPVTLVCEPRASFHVGVSSSGVRALDAPIHLDGPGHGSVVLVGVETLSDSSHAPYSSSRLTAGIEGGGFAEVHVLDSAIEGVAWIPSLADYATGEPGIDVDVPLLWIERSDVHASTTIAPDGAWTSGTTPEGSAAVVATGEVVVLDSTVVGGTFQAFTLNGSCPTGSCPPGPGGAAVRAPALYDSLSTLEAGEPLLWTSGGVPCCRASAGPDLDVNTRVPMAGGLAAWPARIGQPFQVSWSMPSSGPAFLVIGYGVDAPVATRAGPFFLDLSLGRVVLAVPPVGSTGVVNLPADTALIGRELGFQVLARDVGLSRPVAVVVSF